MSHRYPWESTTHSTPQAKFKYSSLLSNLLLSTSTSNPYKLVTSFTTPAVKYTHSTAGYVYPNKYKNRINNSNNSSNNNNSEGSTTTRKYTNYLNSYYTVSPVSRVTSDLNYPKVSPFKDKTAISMMSFATTAKGDRSEWASERWSR